MARVFGLDFGTTNSLVTVIDGGHQSGQPTPYSFLNQQDHMPHPSVVWYPGGEPVVGRPAKDQLSQRGVGVFGPIVSSPKLLLGQKGRESVGGISRSVVDIVADVLGFLRKHAKEDWVGDAFDHAVVTIPVRMNGRARAELREAALKAGIHIHQFVHEPLAALYGYLRSAQDWREQLRYLDGRYVLVFDWGGGTLDLTLCRLQEGALIQVLNSGNVDVGGDKFDMRVRSLVTERYSEHHMAASAEARVIKACEDAKIALSQHEQYDIFAADVWEGRGAPKHLELTLTRNELNQQVSSLVRDGLKCIDRLLEAASLSRSDIEFCLATGGMINMPLIREGLRETFGSNRLRVAKNVATVISEGAAWIAHDNAELTLAKPVELKHADNSYVPVLKSGTRLGFENDNVPPQLFAMYCVDPRDGYAKFEFARPSWPGRESRLDDRTVYGHILLPVDPTSDPLFERLTVEVTIDHNLILKATAISEGRGEKRVLEVEDLEFGLRVGTDTLGTPSTDTNSGITITSGRKTGAGARGHEPGAVRVRSNVAEAADWKLVPGELAKVIKRRKGEYYSPTEQQRREAGYYTPCFQCGRTQFQIERHGCTHPSCTNRKRLHDTL